MAVDKNLLDGIISGLNSMPKKSEIDTPTNNIDLLATETSEGLMSAEDKRKLDEVEVGANNYVLPTAGKDSLGGVKTTSDETSTEGLIPTPIIDGVPYYRDTIYTLPAATVDALGGVKIGKNIAVSEDGTISVSDVSADQMTGIVPVSKGGTGASNASQARLNLKTSCFVVGGNSASDDEANGGYYKLFMIPTVESCYCILRLLISPMSSYQFEEFIVDIGLSTSASSKKTPIAYITTVKEQYDVIDKLYISYDASNIDDGFYFWYKNTSAKSAIRVSVLQCVYSADTTYDGLQKVNLYKSDALTAVDTISLSTPNVVSFDDILSTKLATSSMAGYMPKEDKAKLDALDATLTDQASQLTVLINDAYNKIGTPSSNTTTNNTASYTETKVTTSYEVSKPNGGKTTVTGTDTVRSYKNASSDNDGLLASTDYDYIHSLPDALESLDENVRNDLTSALNTHTTNTSNPHNVTKTQLGLGNVENKSSATIRSEITSKNVTDALGYTPVTPTEFSTHVNDFDDHTSDINNPHSVTKAQVGLGDVENKSSETIRGEITSKNVTDALTFTPAKSADLTSHTSNKSNPHAVTKSQIGLGNVENKSSADIRGELTADDVEAALGYIAVTPTELSDHTSDTGNPHSVTKTQVGLGNVENKSSATIRSEITSKNVTDALGYTPVTPTNFNAHTSDTDNPHNVTKVQLGLGVVENKTSADIRGELTADDVEAALGYVAVSPTTLSTHTSNKSNPHSVTKAQVGLGNVENKSSATIRGEITSKNVTDALGYTPVTPTEFSTHTGDFDDHVANTSNPHSVTKSQVGLGNVENKSSATIRGELTSKNVTDALGYTPPSSVTFTQSLTSGTKVGTLNISGTAVDLYAPTDTDTHWTTKLVVGKTNTDSADAAATNGNVYLNLFDNSTKRNSHKISGTNGVSVTSDSSGNILITGTTYTSVKNPYALTVQYNGTTQVAYDGSAAATVNITPAAIGAAPSHTHPYVPLAGGTMTGRLVINGTVADQPLMVRCIVGYNGTSAVDGLYLQYGANNPIYLGNTGAYTISANGGNYSGNSASATKLTSSAGSATQPIYFSDGKPVACTYTLGKSVPSDAVFTDTVYTHPSHTAYASGLYKITTNALGHVTAATAVTKADITALGVPDSDTKVKQSAITAADYTNWRPIVWGASNSATEGFTPSTVTDGVFVANTISCQPSTGTIKATTFKGALSGKATSAGTADSASKVANSLTIQTNGTTAGTFNGSSAVTVNITPSNIGAAAASHTHSYLPLAGDTMTGTISSSVKTDTHLAGSKGTAIINSTSAAGSYTMLAKMNSTNGYFTIGSWKTTFNLYYTAKSTVDAGINNITKTVMLLDESGNSSFPGTVSAASFSGKATSAGTADSASKVANSLSVQGNGTASFTYDGSAAKTLNIKAGSNVTVTSDTSGNITIASSYTNTKVTAVGNHYTPAKSTTKSASGGTLTDIANSSSGAQVITGIEMDAAGHVTGVTSIALKATNSTYSLAGLMGSSAKGSATQPVYWTGSAWANTTYTLGKSVPSDAVFTDTHYTTHLYAGTSSGVANASTTNGNTYLILTDNSTARNRVKISGSGATTVVSDASGNITISSTDTNTNTLNTAGSTDTSSKIFLIGATSQAANPQTYSDNEVYTTSGTLTTKAVQVGGTAVTLSYDSTNQCLNFVFS